MERLTYADLQDELARRTRSLELSQSRLKEADERVATLMRWGRDMKVHYENRLWALKTISGVSVIILLMVIIAMALTPPPEVANLEPTELAPVTSPRPEPRP